ncbi:MAG TPA: lamin tail domain-containing protein [bacterium]
MEKTLISNCISCFTSAICRFTFAVSRFTSAICHFTFAVCCFTKDNLMKILSILIFLLIILFSISLLQAQTIVINEVMASNSAIIKDEDGDSSDWIELYNNSTDTIDLNGFGLSDDAVDAFKWTFPSVSLEPQEFLVVFASDKDRREWLHWETVIDWGDQWRYRLGTSAPPADWRSIGFNDLSWYQGASGFGYGDNDDKTIVPQVISLFVRKSFTITDKSKILKALLHVDFDDGFVAYLNNVEIARANVGTYGDHPAFNQPAISNREAQMYQGGSPELFILDDFELLFQDGKNVLAIQVHNSGSNSSDLSLIPFLSIGFSTPTSDSSRGMSPFLNPIMNYLHTNFKINADGEHLTLYHSNGQVLDQIDTGQFPLDISYGRQPDGSASWYYFDQPTPGKSNSTPGYISFAREPIFSHQRGFYSQSFQLLVTPSSPQASIYYSLDGSIPTTRSTLYQAPIPVTKTTVVRAREILSNSLPGKIITQTYFINEKINLPLFR